MAHEDRAFHTYRARPGPDTLRALLTAHQATVYNLSFQVLRSTQDAEDAAQEALLEIVKGVAAIREPRAFKRWLCRVALHTALDHLRRRNRRARHEEARAAMKPVPPDPAADAIHEAMSRLDDDDRCLLAEKYFERATLEEIAAREGVSAAAVSKRIDKAKERLRQLLALGGLAAVAAGVDLMLESARPAASIPDLVGTSHALDSALALSGGAVMGTKTVFSATSIAIALVFLTIGAGGGYLAGVKRSEKFTRSISSPSGRSESHEMSRSKTPVAKPAQGNPAVDESPPERPSERMTLAARLNRFMEWRKQYDAEHGVPSGQEAHSRFRAIQRELGGVRDLILGDPKEFLDWVARNTDSPECLAELFKITLGQLPQLNAWATHSYTSFPPELMEGLLLVLQGGSNSARFAVLEFCGMISGAPESYRRQFVALLSDPDFAIQLRAANALLWRREQTSTELSAVMRFLEQVPDGQMDLNLMSQMGRISSPEAREWVLQTLESGRQDVAGYNTVFGLEWWLEPGRVTDASFQRRAARILATSMHKTTSEDAYIRTVFTALNLPSAHSLPLIEQAVAGAPTERLRNAAESVLRKARVDNLGPKALQDAWMAEFKQK